MKFIRPTCIHSQTETISAALWRWESCRTSLGERGSRKDPLLRPFITKHRPLPVGLWGRMGAGVRSRRREWHKGRQRTRQVITHAPSRCPLSQRCSVSGQDTSGEQAGYWLTESKSRSMWRNMLMNGCGFLENYGNICLSLFIFRFAFGMCESTHNALEKLKCR